MWEQLGYEGNEKKIRSTRFVSLCERASCVCRQTPMIGRLFDVMRCTMAIRFTRNHTGRPPHWFLVRTRDFYGRARMCQNAPGGWANCVCVLCARAIIVLYSGFVRPFLCTQR